MSSSDRSVKRTLQDTLTFNTPSCTLDDIIVIYCKHGITKGGSREVGAALSNENGP